MTPTRSPIAPLLALALVACVTRPVTTRAADKVEKLKLAVVKVDSEETAGEDGKGANAVDGNPETIWHTQWQDASPGHPHEIVIRVQPAARLKALTYLTRQGDQTNGNIQEYEVYLSADGKDFGKPVATGSFENTKEKQVAAFPPAQAGFVKLVAKSETNGQAWTSAAEIGVVQEGEKLAVPPRLTIHTVDSQEQAGEDGAAVNAIDGKPDTFWHTQWQDAAPAHPHEIVIRLDPMMSVKGFTYLPRQGESDNGTVKDYEFYVSKDGKEFGQPVSKGTFENTREKKTVTFEPRECQFVKLRALSEVNGNPWSSAAEIRLIPVEQ